MREEIKPARENGKSRRVIFAGSTFITMARIALQAELQRTALLIERTAEPAIQTRMECHTMLVMR